jgi:hypothetical protein
VGDGLRPDRPRHLAAVSERISANAECSDFNGPHQRMAEGAAKLGWSMHTALRNVDPATYDPVAAGYTQFGDPSGSKRGTLNTYLRDAYDHDARILVHTRADRVTVEKGRATGVDATFTDPTTGDVRPIRVNAPIVVAACSALETPALLLRSGIGGPAVGEHLYLHPSNGIAGVYADDQKAWWGPPQAAVMDEFRDLGDGYGLLIEGSQYFAGIIAAGYELGDGRRAKEVMARLARMSSLLFVLREHTGGRVTIDDAGEAVHTYALTDERDVAAFRSSARVCASSPSCTWPPARRSCGPTWSVRGDVATTSTHGCPSSTRYRSVRKDSASARPTTWAAPAWARTP